MQVTLNIDASHIGETVLDLFTNLSAEKKEELALSVMREWLQDPSFLETKNKEQLIIEAFRNKEIDPYWGNSSKKYDQTTSEDEIRKDYNFEKEVRNYKTSKQILIEEVRQEVVEYYKKYMLEEIQSNPTILKNRDEIIDAVQKAMPEIIIQVLVTLFTNSLAALKMDISTAVMTSIVNNETLKKFKN